MLAARLSGNSSYDNPRPGRSGVASFRYFPHPPRRPITLPTSGGSARSATAAPHPAALGGWRAESGVKGRARFPTPPLTALSQTGGLRLDPDVPTGHSARDYGSEGHGSECPPSGA